MIYQKTPGIHPHLKDLVQINFKIGGIIRRHFGILRQQSSNNPRKTHASYCTLIRIDVFGEKILLEVGKEQVIFNAKRRSTPVTVSPVCAIKDFDVIVTSGGTQRLGDFLMDDDLTEDLGNFIQDNNLFLNYEDPGANPPSPNKSPSGNWNPVEEFQDSDDNLGIGKKICCIDDLWDA
ncbi:hypothetical protein Tco_0303436 [Tanacetum coccineum]